MADMDHAKTQKLLARAAEIREQHARLKKERAELLRQMRGLASQQVELKALIQEERAKMRKHF